VSTLEDLRREKREEILRLAELHGCRNVRVFGSFATGENRAASDIDFLVDLDEGRNLFDLGGLLADLKDALASNVDLVEARCLHPYIRDRVLAEALPL
jgi:predicted nucleotidyltransferase